uniref:CCHC-type domain-containing protein n=1 Tax=Cannabis sativa TaxID=3483 RepID=A0A803QAN9_CANSA
MAKTRSKTQGKAKISAKKVRKKGPDSVSDVIRTKSIDEIIGITPLELSEDEDDVITGGRSCNSQEDLFQPPLSPKSSLKEIQRIDEVRNDLLQFIHANNQCNSALAREKGSKVKITLDDIEEEVNFWQPSIVCYVLGSNPPLHILEGFAKRLWKDQVDKDADTNFKKEDVKIIPIWIQLEGLELKYWGQKSLFKIVGQIGKPVMVDSVTRERDRLNYPRILVEVLMNQNFPNLLEFEDEYGSNTTVGVKYEWKPDLCTNCSGMGHLAAECKKRNGSKQEWVIKEDKRKEKIMVDEEGYQAVSKGKKVQEQKSVLKAPSTSNGFQVLAEVIDDNGDVDLQGATVVTMDNTRGGPSLGYG